MTMSVDDLYKALLTSLPVPYGVQRLVLSKGLAAKNWAMLSALASLEYLEPDIDEALGAVANVAVQAAYVTKPGRDLEWLSALALRDRRAGVHAALAPMPGLSPEAYDAIARGTSRAVALLLIQNTAAPLSARQQAARTASGGLAKANRNEIHSWEASFRDFPELRDDMIVTFYSETGVSPNTSPLSTLQGSESTADLDDLSDEAFDVLVKAQATQIRNLRTEQPGYMLSNYDTAMGFTYGLAQMSRLRVPQRKRLLAALSIGRTPTVYGGGPKVTTEEVLAILTTPPVEGDLTRQSATKSTTLAELEEQASKLSPTTPDAAGITSALLCHPLATAALVRFLLTDLKMKATGAGLRKAFSLHLDDPEFVIELVQNRKILRLSEIKATSDPRAVLKALLATAGVAYKQHYIRLLNRDTIGLLPTRLLTEVENDQHALVAQYLLARIGPSKRAWELFEDFLPTSQGTLEELAEQVVILQSIQQ